MMGEREDVLYKPYQHSKDDYFPINATFAKSLGLWRII